MTSQFVVVCPRITVEGTTIRMEGSHAFIFERQVAALCWRVNKKRFEVLLVTSRETKRWVIPKGWPMDRIADFNAAKEEAYEEAGVRGRVRREPLGTFEYKKLYKRKSPVPMEVTVFALEVNEVLKSWPESKERERKWFSREDAAKKVAEPELKELILSFSS